MRRGFSLKSSFSNRYKLYLGLGALTLLMGGCALPGYDSGSFKGGHWYDFGDNKNTTYEEKLAKEDVTDYEPSVVRVTPRVIAYQRQQSTDDNLDPRVAELTKPTPNSSYEVGVGDTLQVIVFGHPELTNPGGSTGGGGGGGGNNIQGQLVNAEGKIYYPYVGEIDASGHTLSQLRKTLTKGLSDYIRDPQIDIRVRQFRSQRVYVSGDISQPCVIPFTDIQLNIIEALNGCNTISTKQGGGNGVQNVRLIRGNESTLINLNKVYASGHQIQLKPNDRLLIDDTANRIYMVGEFDSQQALPYSTGGLYLSDAIANAGGMSLGTADVSKIYVIRGFVDGKDFQSGQVRTQKHPKIYVLDASDPTGLLLANQFELEPRDVVFAAPASFVNFNRALSLILPSINAITTSLVLSDRIGN